VWSKYLPFKWISPRKIPAVFIRSITSFENGLPALCKRTAKELGVNGIIGSPQGGLSPVKELLISNCRLTKALVRDR
jgi:hypothetical protein